jgi:hypothetical protein
MMQGGCDNPGYPAPVGVSRRSPLVAHGTGASGSCLQLTGSQLTGSQVTGSQVIGEYAAGRFRLAIRSRRSGI